LSTIDKDNVFDCILTLLDYILWGIDEDDLEED
jgi:hypothetical protein